MKADATGTPTEQARHRLGWKSWQQRQRESDRNPGHRCSCCRHASQPGVDRYRCQIGQFATAPAAVCPEYAGRLSSLEQVL